MVNEEVITINLFNFKNRMFQNAAFATLSGNPVFQHDHFHRYGTKRILFNENNFSKLLLIKRILLFY